MKRINIATSLNSNYMRYTYVMLTSLFKNHSIYDVHVYLLYSDLSNSDIRNFNTLANQFNQNIHYLPVCNDNFPNELPTTKEWTLETYFRLLLVDLLPMDINRILYLDVDMIINKSIYDLYCSDFEGNLFCACKDMSFNSFSPSDIRSDWFADKDLINHPYFNAGMMLWNIAELRSKYSFSFYIELAKSLDYAMPAPDQDLLNLAHYGQIKYVDEYAYDLFSHVAYQNNIHYKEVAEQTSIIHFAGMKPWSGQYIHYDIEKLWWDYAKQTPFYKDLMEEYIESSIMDSTIYDTISTLNTEKHNLSIELQKSAALCKQLYSLLEK